MLKELLQRGILAIRKSLFDALRKEEQNYFGHKVDANDLLKTRGNDFLNRLLIKIIDSASFEFDALADKINQPNPFAEGSDPDIPIPPTRKSARQVGTISPSDGDVDRDEIRLILNNFVNAQDLSRDEWCAVGMILKRYDFELADFDTWSRDDPRYNANDCASQWNSFKTADQLGDSGYTIATLIALAKKFGYEPQRAKSPVIETLLLSAEQRAFLFSGDFSDLDNARRIEYLHGNHIRFVTNRSQWLIFKNGLWTLSDEGNSAILPATTDLADKLIANADTQDERKIGQRLKMAQQREAAIKTLRGIVSVRITTDYLNRHNNLLNCKNGVVDLQTGKFYEDVDPKLLLTQQCNAIFRPDYRNETVDKFLYDIIPDEPTRAALIRFLGYSATGECSEEKALFCNGDGGNGYATTLKTSAVLLNGRTQDAGAATTELNPLEDCRLAIVEELPQGGKLDVAKFKNLTGGDLIPIRRLHQEQTTIDPHFSPILSGNYLPELSDTRDPGLLRRLMNIHFTQSFIGEKRNPHLKEQLASPDALSGFLTLIINDAKFWYREGLIESDAMKQATRDYLSENDFISEFISEHCERRADLSIPRKQFLERLKSEYPTECARLFNNRDRALVDAICRIDGISYKRTTGGERKFYGIGWRNNATSDDDWQGTSIDPNDLPI